MAPKYSLIIPVYNEEKAISAVLRDLFSALADRLKDSYEVIVIDDGSADKSWEKLSQISFSNLKLLRHPYNLGYGAALKTGAQAAAAKVLIFYDADGQHNSADIFKLVNLIGKYDMVVGSRQGYQGPAWRQPGKKLITLVASYLVNFKIPDLNSGFRAVKKEKFNKFLHLYPNGFSLTTTITLAFLKQGYSVGYVPIKVSKRKGRSTVRPKDGVRALGLVLKMIMLFSPFKVFAPLAGLFFCLSLGSLGVDIFVYHYNLSDTTIFLFINSILIFLIGLLADQIACLRREIKL